MSSDEDLPDDWIPYSKRKDWADVVPLPQDDGENPIVQIAYSDKCEPDMNFEYSVNCN